MWLVLGGFPGIQKDTCISSGRQVARGLDVCLGFRMAVKVFQPETAAAAFVFPYMTLGHPF